MAASSMIPKLRFPGFSREWEAKKLGDIGPVSMCKRILKDETKSVGDVPFYKIGTFGRTPDAFIDFEIFERYKRKYPFPKKGEVLISAAGTIGRLVVYDGQPAYFQDSNIVWIYNDETRVVNDFLYLCYLNTNWKTEDTTIARLYNNNLRSMPVCVPEIPEQQKIAGFLTAVDERISAMDKKVELLQQYRKGVMQKIFTQKLRFRDENSNDYPDWETKKLGELAKIKTGNLNVEDAQANGKYTFFDRSEEIKRYDEYSFDNEALIYAGEGSEFLPRYFSGKYGLHQRAYSVSDAMGLNMKFLYYYMLTQNNHFLRMAVGSTVKSLRMDCFTKCVVPVPDESEQKTIADFLTSLDDKINLEKTKLEQAKLFKKSLLQRMFV